MKHRQQRCALVASGRDLSTKYVTQATQSHPIPLSALCALCALLALWALWALFKGLERLERLSLLRLGLTWAIWTMNEQNYNQQQLKKDPSLSSSLAERLWLIRQDLYWTFCRRAHVILHILAINLGRSSLLHLEYLQLQCLRLISLVFLFWCRNTFWNQSVFIVSRCIK